MLGSLLVFASLIGTTEPRLNSFSEKIEVKVGTRDIITSTDLNLMQDGLKVERPDTDPKSLRKIALDLLINQALIGQYLEKVGMPVTEREVEQKINSIRAAQGATSNEDFRKLLEKQGYSLDRFHHQIRLQIERAQFFSLMRRQATRTIDDKDLKAYYQTNVERFKQNYELELSECVIAFGPDPKLTEQKAVEFEKNPSKFKNCVKDLSVAPSAAQNGMIGKFKKGSLREDLEAKVFNLKENEVAMIRAPGGIQLLKLLKKKNLGPLAFDEAREQVREELESQLAQKEFEKTLSEMKAATFIKIFS